MLDHCSVSCCETAFVRRLDFLIDVSVAKFVKAKERKKTAKRLNIAALLLTNDNTNKAPNKIRFRITRPLCVNVAFIAINVSLFGFLFSAIVSQDLFSSTNSSFSFSLCFHQRIDGS